MTKAELTKMLEPFKDSTDILLEIRFEEEPEDGPAMVADCNFKVQPCRMDQSVVIIYGEESR